MKTIRHIKHPDIHFSKWDKTVNASEFPTVFANSFYLNAVSPGWEALVIGDYESIFPLTIKSKYGYTYLPQPLFTGQLGIYGKINTEIEQVIYDYLKTHFKLIEIELNVTHQLKADGIGSKRTHTIHNGKPYTYNQNCKRNIKKAHALGLQVKEVSKKEVFPLSKKYLNPFLKEELRFNASGIATFNQLVEAAADHNALITFKVIDAKDGVRALAHFISTKQHALYLKGSNFDKKENSGSMHLLMDTAITYFKNRSLIFDFGGGSLPGLANFFKGLGGSPLVYSTLKLNNLPLIVKLLKKKS